MYLSPCWQSMHINIVGYIINSASVQWISCLPFNYRVNVYPHLYITIIMKTRQNNEISYYMIATDSLDCESNCATRGTRVLFFFTSITCAHIKGESYQRTFSHPELFHILTSSSQSLEKKGGRDTCGQDIGCAFL
jgi:hypothetical protein